MELNHAQRLFHAVVVFGAAIAPGCGGKVVFDSGAGGGGGGSSNPSGSVSKSASTSTGVVDPCKSVDPSSCPSPAQYKCSPCGAGFGMKCVCDPKAPSKPSDCATTADFHCQSYMPFTSCTCVPGSPTSPSQCATPASFQCSGGYAPPVGCDCIAIIAPAP